MRLFLCCVALIVAFAVIGDPGGAKCRSDADVYSAAGQLVSKSLVSPGSAQFASIIDPATKIETVNDCHFRVTSFVDSQNRAGGLLRTTFSIEVEYNKASNVWSQRGLTLNR